MSVSTEESQPKAGAAQWVKAALAVGVRSNVMVYVLAFVVALLVGAVLIALTGASITDAYAAMFRGAIFNYQAKDLTGMLKPLTTSVFAGVPLILAGLGLAVGFRAGLFNIGGQGQIIFGAIAAAYIGFTYQLPAGIHLIACIIGAMIAGGLYGGVVGLLKARTGANEVILTIMFNSIAALFLNHLLTKPTFQRPGSSNPQSQIVSDSAQMPSLLPAPFQLDGGFVLAILVAVFVWWFLERSTWGFELRAVGANPNAARTAGMSIAAVTTMTMALSGALAGLAGGTQITSTMKYLTGDVAGSIGFDAITVALLGGNKPMGTFFAGLLFGAFKAGGRIMQAQANVPIDMVLVLQSVIVLLIAAPPFVRWMFRLPKPNNMTIRQYITLQAEKEVAA